MYESIFNIDLLRFIAELLPLRRRKAQFINWCYSLLKPSRNLYDAFIAYRAKSLYKIQHTSQVYSHENVLNDSFDVVARRIYITDGLYKDAVRFYEPEEDKPVHFYEETPVVRFYEPEELILLDVDFIVVVPRALNLTAAEVIRLRSLIDTYRLPDKTYEIRYE